MNVKTYIKETYRNFKRKTADMSKREVLIDYIWEYYKVHILLFVVLAFIVGSFLNASVFNRAKPTYVSLSAYGQYLTNEMVEHTEAVLIDALDIDTSEYSVTVYYFDTGTQDAQMSMTSEEKFVTLVMVREVDVIMAPSEDYEERLFVFHSLDMLMSSEELEALEPHLLYGVTEDNPNRLPYGIRMDSFDSKFLRSNPHFAKDRVLGVTRNSDRLEASKELFRLILGL